jgi:hypothetical protein
MSGSPWLSDSLEAMVLAWLVHDLIELVVASVALLGLVSFLLLGAGHKLASAFVILLCG